jgi:hypothetical protein
VQMLLCSHCMYDTRAYAQKYSKGYITSIGNHTTDSFENKLQQLVWIGWTVYVEYAYHSYNYWTSFFVWMIGNRWHD